MLVRLLPAVLALCACGLTDVEDADVGDAPICAGAERWPLENGGLEEDLQALISELRTTGATCGETELPGVADLTLIPELHCAARLDATVRVETGDIDQVSDVVIPVFARVNLAGYDGVVRHQILAADFFDAQSLLDQWVASEGHCRALLDEELEHVGIGVSLTEQDSRSVWVVLTGHDRAD